MKVTPLTTINHHGFPRKVTSGSTTNTTKIQVSSASLKFEENEDENMKKTDVIVFFGISLRCHAFQGIKGLSNAQMIKILKITGIQKSAVK